MKQFSPVLNIVLLVAVIILYVLHFKTDRKKDGIAAGTTTGTATNIGKVPLVAFVDMDSLHNSLPFIEEKKKELEAEQKQNQAEYEGSYRKLEAEKNEFLKRGSAITQKEADDFQRELMEKQQQIEGMKQAKGQSLAQKGSTIMEDIQKKLKTFLSNYNKDKKYAYILATGTGMEYILYKDSMLNITGDIIKGMNEEMSKKGNQ